jgi:hypothetical protein
MKRSAALAALSLLAAGCGNDAMLSAAGASNGDGDDGMEHAGSCAKIEGADIGVENLTIEVGGKTLTFHSWVLKNGEAGEYIGFSFAASGPLSVRVKAGGETYDAEGGTWANPNAATDASASAVSNVEGCDPDGEEPDGDGNTDDPDSSDDGDVPDNN